MKSTAQLRRGAHHLRERLTGTVAHRGLAVHCPCCGSDFSAFAPASGPDRVCWRCGSMERERLLWLYLDRHPERLRPGMRILHVAPERALMPRLNRLPDVRYVGGDIDGHFGPARVDVTDIEYRDGFFDAIICNHVLEHVPDDRRAMRELRRVLAPGGWAVLLVPDVREPTTLEDDSVTGPEERRQRFGQADHVRRYGWDYLERLQRAGFTTEVVRLDGVLAPDEVKRMRLAKFGEVEPLFVCTPA